VIATKVEFEDDVVVVHNFCVHCKTEGMYQITLAQWNAWQVMGQFIQHVFPDKTPGEREFMINGVHPQCYDAMWAIEQQPLQGFQVFRD